MSAKRELDRASKWFHRAKVWEFKGNRDAAERCTVRGFHWWNIAIQKTLTYS